MAFATGYFLRKLPPQYFRLSTVALFAHHHVQMTSKHFSVHNLVHIFRTLCYTVDYHSHSRLCIIQKTQFCLKTDTLLD